MIQENSRTIDAKFVVRWYSPMSQVKIFYANSVDVASRAVSEISPVYVPFITPIDVFDKESSRMFNV